MRNCSAPPWAATSRCASTTICTTCRCRARLAVDYLAKHVPGIRDLPYFHHMQTQLFGLPVMISRTGYTGERGYEIFCRGQDAGTIWDTILAEGKKRGHHPVPLHHARHAARRELPAVLSLRQFAEISVRQRRARRHAVGARPRLHRQPRQDRVPRRRGALPPQGQGALQDFRRAARRQGAGRRRRAGLSRRQEGRRRDLRHVFAAGQEIDGHRPARRRLRGRRAPSSRSATRAARSRRRRSRCPSTIRRRPSATRKG